ncbi:hypothetical protein J4234_05855 [Candidatus Woesearchaeota archaeon]|nr:hypothetical protein [Candidatus Woesearchaeota archaeon]
MKLTQYDFSRRDLLLLTAGAALYTLLPKAVGAETKLSGDKIFPKYEILQLHVVPDSVRPADIAQVVAALKSGTPVGTAAYVPAFVDIANYVHHLLSGMSYPEHMRKSYGSKKPLEVAVIKGLSKMGMNGAFHNENDLGSSNRVYIDAGNKPAKALRTLVHDLGHSCFGSDEFIPYANEHLELSHMVAKFPRLVREKDEECPLSAMLDYYSLGVKPEEQGFMERLFAKFSSNGECTFVPRQAQLLTYLAFLSADLKGKGLEYAKSKIFDLTEERKEILLKEAIAALASKKQRYREEILGEFASATESYILRHTTSEDRRELVKRKAAGISAKAVALL